MAYKSLFAKKEPAKTTAPATQPVKTGYVSLFAKKEEPAKPIFSGNALEGSIAKSGITTQSAKEYDSNFIGPLPEGAKRAGSAEEEAVITTEPNKKDWKQTVDDIYNNINGVAVENYDSNFIGPLPEGAIRTGVAQEGFVESDTSVKKKKLSASQTENMSLQEVYNQGAKGNISMLDVFTLTVKDFWNKTGKDFTEIGIDKDVKKIADTVNTVVKSAKEFLMDAHNLNIDHYGFDPFFVTGRDKKYTSVEEMEKNGLMIKALNSPQATGIMKVVSEKTRNLPLKGYALYKSLGQATYTESLDALMKDADNPDNSYSKRLLYQVQDSGAQTAVGVLLSLATTAITKSPKAGQVVAGSYWTALSAAEQLENKGEVYSLGNIAIDVALDSYLGSTIEGIFKKGGEGLLKNALTGFVAEGGTESMQTLLKYGNDYANAKTEEEKQKIIEDTKQYVKSGGILTEFLVGGISGGGISVIAGGIHKVTTMKEKTELKSDSNKIQEKIKELQAQPESQEKQEVIQVLTEQKNKIDDVIKQPSEEEAKTEAEIKRQKAIDYIKQKSPDKFRVEEEPLVVEAKKYKSAEEFFLNSKKGRDLLREKGIKGQEAIKNWFKNNISDAETYKMSHRPSETGAIASDITKNGNLIPKNFYEHPEYYSDLNQKTYKESFEALKKVKDNPEAEITIYRAGKNNEFNNGDWVTLSKEYAKGEMRSDTKVYSKTVKAKDIQFAGDDINEFGFYPKSQLTDIYNKANTKSVQEEILARKPNKAEARGGTLRQRGFNNVPVKEGYDVVYKPYGKEGAGYYYIKSDKERIPGQKVGQTELFRTSPEEIEVPEPSNIKPGEGQRDIFGGIFHEADFKKETAQEKYRVEKVSDETETKNKARLDKIKAKPDLFQFSRRYEKLSTTGFAFEKVAGLAEIFDINKLEPIEVGIFNSDIEYELPNNRKVKIEKGVQYVISGHNRLELMKRNADKIQDINKYIKVKHYPGTNGGIKEAVADSIITNVENKSIKEIEIIDNAINGLLNESDLKVALDFNTSKIKFYSNIIKSFKDNNLIDFWNKAVATKLSTLKELDFGILQERLNFVERIAKKTSESMAGLTPEQQIAVKNQVGDKISEVLQISKKATLKSVENQIANLLNVIKDGGFTNKQLVNLFGEVQTETVVEKRSPVRVLEKEIDIALGSVMLTGDMKTRLLAVKKAIVENNPATIEYINKNGGLTATAENTKNLIRQIIDPNFVLPQTAKPEVTKIKEAETADIEKELLALNKKMLGDENLKIINQLLTPNNQKALGSYIGNLIKIVNGQADPKATLYHEAVHKALDIFLTLDEQADLLLAAQEKYKIDDFAEIEERLAEDFIAFAKLQETITGKLKVIFDTVLKRLQGYIDNKSDIDAFYKQLSTGKLAKEKVSNLTKQRTQKVQEVLAAKTGKPKTEINVGVVKEQLPVKTEGKAKVSRLEARMKNVFTNASAETIEKLGLSTYEQMNKESNINEAVKYVTENKEEALKVLSGEIEPPKGILKNSIFVAMNKVADEGDMGLALKLTSLSATRMGQEISILTELDEFSASSSLNNVYKIFEKEYERRIGKSLESVKKDKKARAKKAMTEVAMADFSNLIESLKC